MSDWKICNYCSLKLLEKKARQEKKKLIKRPSKGKLGGIDIFITNGEPHHRNFRAWFWEITKGCAC